MGIFNWSRATGGANGNSDSTVNFLEGQAPSSLNDSCRNLMAGVAQYRDDISGAIVTSGSSTAYTVASYSVFDTLAHLSGQMIAFTPHATNGATVTINVDGLGAMPLRSAPNAELLAGVLIQGTPYCATFNNSDGAWYLQGFFGNPYNIPLGAGMDYWLSTAPNSSFVFPIGQAISRTTYATLFAAMGTTYGTGDGSTTFNIPDKRGRVSAAADGGTGRFTNIGTGLGNAGGEQSHTLAASELAPHTHSGTTQGMNANDPHTHGVSGTSSANVTVGASSSSVTGPGVSAPISSQGLLIESTSINHGHSFTTGTGDGVSGNAHNNIQPTIVCNYILRII